MKRFLSGIVIGGLLLFAYQRVNQTHAQFASADPSLSESIRPQQSGDIAVEATSEAPRFVCDGRVYCSQMHSCEEATFFLQNCPGVKMDGEGDGVPCEKQWCGRQ